MLSLLLGAIAPVLAAYNPPPDQPPPRGNTSSSAPRGGCASSQGLPLTVLAPLKHVGQTASVRPMFAWFVPDTKPFPLEFKLFELTGNNTFKLVEKVDLQSSSGIMKLSLPENKPGLAVGQRYLWQIALKCDSNHPSTWVVSRAQIEVVEMPSNLRTVLSTTKNPLEISDLYARAGLWYDALSEALKAVEGSRLGEVASTLLEDLAKLEEPQQSANLRQIASSER
ncbi:MAG TPA: hypothetical protein DCY88_05275 [Cyanobacteria bacterium UBA11372]|nr:hypothetical protein [Cyanobacteria bacterium UBA11372]